MARFFTTLNFRQKKFLINACILLLARTGSDVFDLRVAMVEKFRKERNANRADQINNK